MGLLMCWHVILIFCFFTKKFANSLFAFLSKFLTVFTTVHVNKSGENLNHTRLIWLRLMKVLFQSKINILQLRNIHQPGGMIVRKYLKLWNFHNDIKKQWIGCMNFFLKITSINFTLRDVFVYKAGAFTYFFRT